MTKAEMRSLRFQLLLTAALFAVSVAGAAGIVCSRGLFERWLFEKHTSSYETLPKRLRETFDRLCERDTAANAAKKLSEEDREAIYQCCLGGNVAARQTVAEALCREDAGFFVKLAERTVVVGNGQQRLEAIEFLEGARCREACQAVSELSAWAQRRQRRELWQRLEAAAEKLKPYANTASATQDSPSSGEPRTKASDA